MLQKVAICTENMPFQGEYCVALVMFRQTPFWCGWKVNRMKQTVLLIEVIQQMDQGI
jgi:hypothetical protein